MKEKKTMREQISSRKPFETHIRNSYGLINKLSRLRPSAIRGLAKNNVQTSLADAAVLRDLYLTQALVSVCRKRVKICGEEKLRRYGGAPQKNCTMPDFCLMQGVPKITEG
jgi:hypothetical protein